ncbi:hypothetical protein ACN8ZM_40240 (plasmid) [Burkholderia aenigmatica]|uniref:hypothetical protein n=1 Tax=Burkholderia aenigmatica TaxID=2015348 RepID=UPI003B42F2CB
MLIREHGQTVKLLRLEVRPGTNRKRQVVIGTFRSSAAPPGALLAELSSVELKALNKWLDAQQQLNEYAAMREVTHSAPNALGELARALEVAAETLSADQADAIWTEIGAIARALKRADHQRPRRSRVAHSVPGQLDLVELLSELPGKSLS